MSHVSKYAQKITDVRFFCRIAEEQGHNVRIAQKGLMTVKQFGRNKIGGAIATVLFNGWKYPCAIMPNGEILYDHWGSKPGTIGHLGQTLQQYNHQMVLKNIDYTVVDSATAKTKDNGDIVITLQY